ncbi:MAG: hypothetical protein IKS02_07225 [Fibrobacter sp.]|nr:hypothetical protein [Fibrobacter sp.]
MRLIPFAILAFSVAVLAESPATVDSSVAVPQNVPADTIYDTVFVDMGSGIPWNNEYFDPNRLLRHETFDPALSVAYTYSVSFFSSPWGSFSQQSYLAHLAYQFTPELRLYADMGLWMPLYAHWNGPKSIAREDVQQGNVQFVLPGVELEYKPTNNTTFRLMLINENDALKAYGPWRHHYGRCSSWSDSYYCR